VIRCGRNGPSLAGDTASVTTEAEPNTVNGLALQRERLLTAIADIKPYALDAATRKRLQDLERQIRKVAAKLDEQG
jgi:hypothetical protein